MKVGHTTHARHAQRWLIAALLAVMAFVATPTLASADSGSGTAALSTHQLSYSPGGVVDLSGSGFAGGDAVTVTVADSLTGTTIASAGVTVASDGTFNGVDVSLPSDFYSSLTATATDAANGDTASITIAETLAPPSFTPTITTDQLDYAPGSVVTIRGSGWPADDSVSVYTDDSAGSTWSETDQVTTDSNGDFTDKVTLPLMFIANYSVTATDTAGLTATTTFTDSQPQNLTVANSNVTVASSGTADYGNVTLTFNGNNNACTVDLFPRHGPSDRSSRRLRQQLVDVTGPTQQTTFKITTTSATPLGSTTFKVVGTPGRQLPERREGSRART